MRHRNQKGPQPQGGEGGTRAENGRLPAVQTSGEQIAKADDQDRAAANLGIFRAAIGEEKK